MNTKDPTGGMKRWMHGGLYGLGAYAILTLIKRPLLEKRLVLFDYGLNFLSGGVLWFFVGALIAAKTTWRPSRRALSQGAAAVVLSALAVFALLRLWPQRPLERCYSP